MKFFNADGTIKHEKNNDEDFGWVWKNLLEDRGMKMVIYNFDGSVRSEEYYNENNDWEIVTDNEKEDRNQDDKTEPVNTIKWYQRTFSNIQEDTKTNLLNLLISLDNKESHLILSIINSAILNFLPDTNLRKPSRIYTALRYSDINNDVTKTLRLCDRAEVDPGPKRVEIDKSKEPYTDIDQTLLKLLDKTCEMHCEVEKIRKCFLEYENKIEMLSKECKNIIDDIFECKYLDNIILCLNYKIENANFNWPFRSGNGKGSDSLSRNLII